MTFKKAYYYLFYKLYRYYEGSPSVWWSDWKATVSMLVLEVWFLISVVIYYEVITKKDLFPDNIMTIIGIILVLVLSMIKYFAFEYQDRWKGYIKEFSQWPKSKNRIGTFVVWLIILFVVGNLIFSFYLMSQIDWKQYR